MLAGVRLLPTSTHAQQAQAWAALLDRMFMPGRALPPTPRNTLLLESVFATAAHSGSRTFFREALFARARVILDAAGRLSIDLLDPLVLDALETWAETQVPRPPGSTTLDQILEVGNAVTGRVIDGVSHGREFPRPPFHPLRRLVTLLRGAFIAADSDAERASVVKFAEQLDNRVQSVFRHLSACMGKGTPPPRLVNYHSAMGLLADDTRRWLAQVRVADDAGEDAAGETDMGWASAPTRAGPAAPAAAGPVPVQLGLGDLARLPFDRVAANPSAAADLLLARLRVPGRAPAPGSSPSPTFSASFGALADALPPCSVPLLLTSFAAAKGTQVSAGTRSLPTPDSVADAKHVTPAATAAVSTLLQTAAPSPLGSAPALSAAHVASAMAVLGPAGRPEVVKRVFRPGEFAFTALAQRVTSVLAAQTDAAAAPQAGAEVGREIAVAAAAAARQAFSDDTTRALLGSLAHAADAHALADVCLAPSEPLPPSVAPDLGALVAGRVLDLVRLEIEFPAAAAAAAVTASAFAACVAAVLAALPPGPGLASALAQLVTSTPTSAAVAPVVLAAALDTYNEDDRSALLDALTQPLFTPGVGTTAAHALQRAAPVGSLAAELLTRGAAAAANAALAAAPPSEHAAIVAADARADLGKAAAACASAEDLLRLHRAGTVAADVASTLSTRVAALRACLRLRAPPATTATVLAATANAAGPAAVVQVALIFAACLADPAVEAQTAAAALAAAAAAAAAQPNLQDSASAVLVLSLFLASQPSHRASSAVAGRVPPPLAGPAPTAAAELLDLVCAVSEPAPESAAEGAGAQDVAPVGLAAAATRSRLVRSLPVLAHSAAVLLVRIAAAADMTHADAILADVLSAMAVDTAAEPAFWCQVGAALVPALGPDRVFSIFEDRMVELHRSGAAVESTEMPALAAAAVACAGAEPRLRGSLLPAVYWAPVMRETAPEVAAKARDVLEAAGGRPATAWYVPAAALRDDLAFNPPYTHGSGADSLGRAVVRVRRSTAVSRRAVLHTPWAAAGAGRSVYGMMIFRNMGSGPREQLRALWVDGAGTADGGTFCLPGGSVPAGVAPVDALRDHVLQQMGIDAGSYDVVSLMARWQDVSGTWELVDQPDAPAASQGARTIEVYALVAREDILLHLGHILRPVLASEPPRRPEAVMLLDIMHDHLAPRLPNE